MRPHARRRATVVTASSSGEMSSEQREWFQQRAYDFEVEVGALKTLYRDVTAAERKEERRERLALAATSVGGLEAGWMTRATGLQRLNAGVDKYKLENPGKTTAFFNHIIIFGTLLGTMKVLLMVDVGRPYAAHWTWDQYMTHLVPHNLKAYRKLVNANPVFAKACTSGVAYALGDLLAQRFQGRSNATVNMNRVLRSGFAGFMVHGPLCHYWMLAADQYLSFAGPKVNVLMKVFADQTVWSLFLNAGYTTVVLGLQGYTPPMISQEIQLTWFKALSAGWRLWPFVHMLTFSGLIPMQYRLLFVDAVEVIWVVILSTTINASADANKDTNVDGDAVMSCSLLEGATPVEKMALMAEEQTQVGFEVDGKVVYFKPDKDACLLEERPEGEGIECQGDGCEIPSSWDELPIEVQAEEKKR